ncbi:ATP-grasp fold amidoligase family protein [Phytohalomonas tamaricis]|uniref:ATP-grasp fold amidoligase family protein n=1 Tax=Phytohalomonas tamaricis TaxID=2081032 RepID=UPI000D0B8E54|nr:ATP-grasp fold amidoligase family protein [Phytohalomonas tamaricis]
MHVVRKKITRKIPDKLCISFAYLRTFGRLPNLTYPKTFNEKICRRRLYPDPVYSILSDKVRVRDYVELMIGKKYLLPHYNTCRNLSVKTYEQLPESFVMKCNHGSGYNLIVKDKSRYSYATLFNKSTEWLASNYYASSRELHYKNIKPQLIFEKLLLDEQGNVPKDYKFYCFRKPGETPVVFIEVTHDRFSHYKVDYYDQDWELVKVVEDRFTTGKKIAKPDNLDEAITLALKLSEGFSFARVDFYMLQNHIYFGEITFTPTGGLKHFKSRAIDKQWGALFDR